MKRLALDPAELCGYAYQDGDELVSGVWDLSRGDKHPGGRGSYLRSMIFATARRLGGLDLVALEEASKGSHHMQTIVFHNRLRGVIEVTACELGAAVLLVNPTTLKAWATGSGRADKQQMMRALETHYRLVVNDDNAADAIWVLKFAEQPRIPVPPKERKRRIKRAAKKLRRLF